MTSLLLKPNQRRVRCVHLSAPSQSLVQRGTLLLEDALNTASIPGEVEGRLLFIRYLPVGNIQAQASSSQLSIAIEKVLAQIASQAIYAIAPEAAKAPAVYFCDRIEPYISLAMKLAQGHPPQAWFWPLAVPGWQPHLPSELALREILFAVAQTEMGVGAMASLIGQLLQMQRIDPLLRSLSSSNGNNLLQVCGWSQPNVLNLSNSPTPPLIKWCKDNQSVATLYQWSQCWGEQDARSIWLAAMLCINEQPNRVLDPYLVEKSQRLIQQILKTEVYSSQGLKLKRRQPPADSELSLPLELSDIETPHPYQQSRQLLNSRSDSAPSPPEPKDEPTESKNELRSDLGNRSSLDQNDERHLPQTTKQDKRSFQRRDKSSGIQEQISEKSSTSSPQSISTSQSPSQEESFVNSTVEPLPRSLKQGQPLPQISTFDKVPKDSTLESLPRSLKQPQPSPQNPTLDQTPSEGVDLGGDSVEQPASSTSSPPAVQSNPTDPQAISKQAKNPTSPSAPPQDLRHREIPPQSKWKNSRQWAEEKVETPAPEGPQPTMHAGFFFLLPLLNRLDITAFLRHHPHCIEVDFPQNLLCQIGHRLEIPEHDPIWASLHPYLEPLPKDGLSSFVVPETWCSGIAESEDWQIQRGLGSHNQKVLLDRTGRLPLGLWSGKAPDAVRTLIGGQSLWRAPGQSLGTGWELLLKAWHIAIRRWCRRYAHMGLYNLVCRPGRIQVTPTHVDVMLPLDQTDVWVRKVGLDLNPGWVPWFGRVVQFHYLERE